VADPRDRAARAPQFDPHALRDALDDDDRAVVGKLVVREVAAVR
jgi:hypothetical protein